MHGVATIRACPQFAPHETTFPNQNKSFSTIFLRRANPPSVDEDIGTIWRPRSGSLVLSDLRGLALVDHLRTLRVRRGFTTSRLTGRHVKRTDLLQALAERPKPAPSSW
jgi:hypothetical protein